MESNQAIEMFARVAVGLLIGFIAGFVEAFGSSLSKKLQTITEVLLFLVAFAFIVSSFMFGAIYGVIAIVEITIGFYLYGKAFRSEKSKS